MKTRLYKVLNKYILTAMVLLAGLSCKKAKENIDILINADIFDYTVLVELNDGSGQMPQGLDISVSGDDAAAIYDIAGNKKLELNNGLITLALHPKVAPATGKPIRFNLKISGAGYNTAIIPVLIEKQQFSQVKQIKVIKLSSPPAGVNIVTDQAPLQPNGTSSQAIIVRSVPVGAPQEATTVTVPANTQFLTAADAQIQGNSVELNVINYSTRAEEIATLFPGGTFAASNVTNANNQTTSAFFLPAGFATVNLRVNDVEVKKFSQPINISIEIDPTYRLLSTNQTVKAGDQLSIWSYSEETGRWTYEKEGVVTIANSKPTVNFTTSHLTGYAVTEYVETSSCTSPSMVFNAPWLKTDTQPLILEIWNNDETKLLAQPKTIVVNNGLEYVLNDLPSFAVKYKVLTNQGEVLASGSIADPCSGAKVNATVAAPAVPVVGISLSLTVKCPGKGIVTPPNFYLYYKAPGAPATEYKLLGIVKQGKLSTTLLSIGQRYDFKAQWGSREKIIKNYLIDNDNLSTTVGLEDHIGDISPEKNREILIEECSKI